MQNYSALELSARNIEERLAKARADLDILLLGRTQLGKGDSPRVDITQQTIDEHKETIANLENLLKEKRDQLDGTLDY